MVRRLPVLQTPPAGEDAAAEARPAGQWVAIGAALVVVLFCPLAILGMKAGFWVARRFDGSNVWMVAPVLVAYAIAAGSTGAILGRFGRRAGARSIALSGALGGTALVVLAALAGQLSDSTVAFASTFILVVVGASFALLGARSTRRPWLTRDRNK